MPGKFLADIYLKYGSKLLQGNVRAFLSVRGKVNKGIRNTIINHPENFFTFNNGIAVVARSVSFSADKTQIVHFKDTANYQRRSNKRLLWLMPSLKKKLAMAWIICMFR